MTDEQRVGYWGKDDIPIGVAFAGVLHLEFSPGSFTAVCQPGRRFSAVSVPSILLTAKGYQIPKLRICKRCERR